MLRGINVGRAKRVAMADLRLVYEQVGYGEVRTLLNSGNVVFTGPESLGGDAAAGLERALAERTGVSSTVVLLSAAELAAMVADNPLTSVATDPARLLVVVPARASGLEPVRALVGRDWAPEALAVGSRAAYLWCPVGVLASRLPTAVEAACPDVVTTRSWTTVRKLHTSLAG